MTVFRFANFADTVLTRRLMPTGSVAFVELLDVAAFPLLSAGQVFAAVLQDGKQAPEIVYVTTNPLDGSFDIERGKEDTVANEWPIGTQFTQTLTRDSIDYFTSGGSDSWIATLQDGINSANARIDDTNTVVATNAIASAVATSTVAANLGTTSALLGTTRTALASLTTAQATLATTLTARQDSVEANFSTLDSAVTAFNIATASHLSTLDASTGTNSANISTLLSARTSDLAAQATTNTSLTTSIGVNTAVINALNTAFTGQYSSLATSLNTLSTNFGTNNASVTAQFLVQAGINTSVAASITSLTAFEGAGPYATSADLTNEASVRAGADSAMASDITTLNATTGGLTAGAATELIARVNGDAANATSITSVSVSLGTLGATVAINSSAVLDLSTSKAAARLVLLAGAIGGSPAQIGFYSDNQGTSDLALLAKHIFWGANSYFDDATDTVRTIYGGVSQRVIAFGAPFGVHHNLTEWQGPASVAFEDMDTPAAHYYRTHNGYTGGSKLGLTLAYVASTDSLSSSATVSSPTFVSSGGTVTVTVTYLEAYDYSNTTAPASGPSTGVIYDNSGSNSVVMRIDESLDAGATWNTSSWDVAGTPATLTAAGSWLDTQSSLYSDDGFGGPGYVIETLQHEAAGVSGTFNSADTSGATRQYRVTITSRSLNFSPQTQNLAIQITQT